MNWYTSLNPDEFWKLLVTSCPLATAWNVLGLALLMNVVVVGILSTPRFAYFGAERLNARVMYPPFVWLPAVMVLAALAGHVVVFRALAAPKQEKAGA